MNEPQVQFAPSPVRVLVIDANAADHHSFHDALSVELHVECTTSGAEGVSKVRQALADAQPFALAFIDISGSATNGLATIRELWQLDKNLQVVICTEHAEHSHEALAAELRTTDQMVILRKPFEPAEVRQMTAAMADKWLLRRQRNELEKILLERDEELRRTSLHDNLTGLPNRLLFHDRLTNALRRSKRDANYCFAVLFVDCDRFKIINDSLGHGVGDQLLLQIADRLKGAVRDVDTITWTTDTPIPARLGGDEFAIILDRVGGDVDAARVARRLLAALARPYSLNGHEVQSTASIGITTSSLHYETAEEMVRDADTAMYRAKMAGGSTFVLFDEKMHREAVDRLTLENDLRRAVERGEILVHYQPILAMRTQQLLGFEALARWNHPKRGWITPNEFIPLAEETGIIIPLGVWVLEKACRQLAQWQSGRPELSQLTMSVNLSRKQLVCAELLSNLRRVLAETKIRPENLKLEITESTIMENPDKAVKILQEIQDMGVQLQIDDFGTGYSSLSCLHHFPLDGLKIHREFVSGVTSHSQAAVLKTVVSLAHNLHIPLVAEGIETPEQIAALEAMGCDQAQGYLFAMPMDAQDAGEFISRQINKSNAA